MPATNPEDAAVLLRRIFARVPVDPKYLERAPGEPTMCAGCGVRRGTEAHHQLHKAMGGRHGVAKRDADNTLILLCDVCHHASHFRRTITADGFCCAICPKLPTCYYGQRVVDPDQAPTPMAQKRWGSSVLAASSGPRNAVDVGELA